MIKCPKCGFTQPKDKYCAQCGIDIERYQPVREPLSRRLLASSGFYIFLASVVLVATFYLIYFETRGLNTTKGENVAASSAATTRPNPVVSNTPPAPTAPSTTESTKPTNLASATHSATGNETREASSLAPQTTTTTPISAPPSTPPATPAATPTPVTTKLRIFYVEALTSTFQGGSGLTDRDVLFDSNGQVIENRVKVLAESVMNDIAVDKEYVDAQTTTDARIEHTPRSIGTTLRFTPRAVDEKSIRLDINISARWPNMIVAPGRIGVQSNSLPPYGITITNGRLHFIGGLISSHRSFTSTEDVLKELVGQNQVLRVMLSPNFTAQPPAQTDFFIILDHSVGDNR